jgi:two-component system, response regulator PdtaR
MNQRLRVVAADDDPDCLQALAEALRALGHQVDAEARTGRQLVERCRAVCPDLIVADIDMPRLDGIAAVAEVCRQRPTPVVVVSGYYDLELQEHARHACVMAYLVKPVGLGDLGPAVSLAWWRFGLFQGSPPGGGRPAPGAGGGQGRRVQAVPVKRGRVGEVEAYRRLPRLDNDWARGASAREGQVRRRGCPSGTGAAVPASCGIRRTCRPRHGRWAGGRRASSPGQCRRPGGRRAATRA